MVSIATLLAVIFSAMALPRERGKINISNEFINSVRLQLTRDNYDYSEEEDASKRDVPQMRANSKHEGPYHKNTHPSTRDYQKKQVTRYNYYIPTLARHVDVKVDDHLGNKQAQKVEHTVSNRDLLYYVDDRELVPERKEQSQTSEVRHNKASATKYKILKLKHQYRRQNQPRLIQEESMGTVAIVNLDGGPIPEVRLPPSRRQYMLDKGEIVGEEDELPPPVINSSEPEAAPEEAYSKSNLTIAPEINK